MLKLFYRPLDLLKPRHARFSSRKWTILEQMAGMVSRLNALETGDAPEHFKPGDLAGPKPNALRENPLEEPIPPMPASVRGYPTPWVTEYDVLSYVYPLYTRGWGQSLNLWKPPPPKEAQDTDNRPPDRYTMLLSAQYQFQDFASAASFFLKVASAVNAEDVSAHCHAFRCTQTAGSTIHPYILSQGDRVLLR